MKDIDLNGLFLDMIHGRKLALSHSYRQSKLVGKDFWCSLYVSFGRIILEHPFPTHALLLVETYEALTPQVWPQRWHSDTSNNFKK